MKLIRSTVVAVDDNDFFLDALRRLGGRAGFDLVGSAGGRLDALALVEEHRPNVLLLDFEVPGMDSLGLIPDVLELSPATAVVILSSHITPPMIRACVRAGASGYIAKDADLAAIRTGIARAAAGEFVLCPLAAAAMGAHG